MLEAQTNQPIARFHHSEGNLTQPTMFIGTAFWPPCSQANACELSALYCRSSSRQYFCMVQARVAFLGRARIECSTPCRFEVSSSHPKF